MYPLTVVRQTIVNTSWEHCWRCLTTPGVVSEWFAETDTISPGERVVFDFGDGDFFAGRVTHCEPPSKLRLNWRFWDVGPSYDISYVLAPLGNAVEVSVIDCGSGSSEEVDSLREGWEDFLTRLKKRAETGEACRYRWTECLGSSCFAENIPELRARLADARWWQSWFPQAGVTVRLDNKSCRLELSEPGWNGIVTNAHVRFDSHLGRSCLKATHTGWTAFTYETQVENRRRYAGLWREMLASVETEFRAGSAERYAIDVAS
jgi:uncharacterized protein YndB with AHSA1/START domain